MKKIWVAVLMFVLPLIFTLKVNAQAVSDNSSKAEINKLFDTVPLENMDKHGVSVKKLGLSASAGIGLNYGFGEKKAGKLSYYKSKAIPTSLRLGYSPIKYLEVQGEYSSGSTFRAHGHSAAVEEATMIFNFTAFTANLKVGAPMVMNEINFYPYIIIGAGKVKIDNYSELNWPSLGLYGHTSETSSRPCFKSGVGVEIKLGEHTFAFSEANNWRVKWKNPYNKKTWMYSQILLGLGVKF